MSRRMTLETWFNAQRRRRLYHHELPVAVRMPPMPGIRVDGVTLMEPDGTRLAEFTRHGEDALVRLVLPNPQTIGRYRAIRDAVLSQGGKFWNVPRNTFQIADLQPETVEVIHTRFSKHPFRADEQLLKGTVRAIIWAKDHWGYKSVQRYEERTTYFLSGYDSNESGLSYFFCELPPGVEPKTIREAYETLKPESVKTAEAAGLTVKRQGDMFFIRMKGLDVPEEHVYGGEFLHNSNHVAERYYRHDGLSYVQGRITHAPRGRRPDHAPLKLGRKHWWLCVRNTVPISR